MMKQKNIIKTQIIIKNTGSYHIQTYIHGQLATDYLKLKESRGIRKDSKLVRPIIRCGIVTALWLEERGLFNLYEGQLTKILHGLSKDERTELFAKLQQEFAV